MSFSFSIIRVALVSLCCCIGLKGQVVLLDEDFGQCQGNGWQVVSAPGTTDDWICTSISGKKYMNVNDDDGISDEVWLISPSIDLDVYQQEYLQFRYTNVYNDDGLVLMYSTDYSSNGAYSGVDQATWNALPTAYYDFSNASYTNQLAYHQAVDLSQISGSSVHLAFVFQSQGTQQEWSVDEIRVIADYYSNVEDKVAGGERCTDLKSSIRMLIDGHDRISYTSSAFDVWDAFYSTDKRLNDAGTQLIVHDMYTDQPQAMETFEFIHGSSQDSGGGVTGEGQTYNREHTFPKSWWGSGDAAVDTQYTDLHHIVPSDRFVNTKKSNHPLGTTSSPSFTSTNGSKVGTSAVSGYAGGVFEPIDAFKGDFARMYLYMITRYESLIPSWFSNRPDVLSMDAYLGYQQWLLELLVCWHETDPVSQKEQDRNNAVYAIQDNRNPFIDHPEYVGYIWGNCSNVACPLALPVTLMHFSAKALQDGYSSLAWKVADEINLSHYSIEHSADGHEFSEIAIKNPDIGETKLRFYNHIHDKALLGDNYYRLRIVDLDGSYTYSETIHVYHYPGEVRVFPTITTGVLNIDIPLDNMKVSIYSSAGILIRQADLYEQKTYQFDLGQHGNGMYIVKISDSSKVWNYKVQLLR